MPVWSTPYGPIEAFTKSEARAKLKARLGDLPAGIGDQIILTPDP